jgi:hypothetical protein
MKYYRWNFETAKLHAGMWCSKNSVEWTHCKVYDDGTKLVYVWKCDRWQKSDVHDSQFDRFCDEITEDELFIDMLD